MSNRRTYVRVYDDLIDHPAWEELDLQHIGLWVLALGHCSRNLTDGHVSLRRLAKLGGSPETITELVEAGRLHAPGHECEECPPAADGGVYVHNYLAHQRSKEAAEHLSTVRKAAGQKGGQAKAKQVAKQESGNAKQTPGIDRDRDKEQTPAPAGAESAEFAAFWTAYPRKVGRTAAAKAYHRASLHTAPPVILDGLHNAVQGWTAARTLPRFIPYASTWLNAGRWADEVPLPDMPTPSRPTTTVAVCRTPETCPGRHTWTDAGNTYTCLGA